MKKQFWLTVVVLSSLLGPAAILAQGVQDGLPLPHNSANNPGSVLPHGDTAIPSRRVPGLTPPKQDHQHPVSPVEAWPTTKPSTKSHQPSVKPDAENNITGDTFPDKYQPTTEQSLE